MLGGLWGEKAYTPIRWQQGAVEACGAEDMAGAVLWEMSQAAAAPALLVQGPLPGG